MDHHVMKCPNGCRCNRHRKPPNNTAIAPEREHLSTTYGDQQRARCQRAMNERHARGIVWRDTPSEFFDWDRAIEGFKQIMKERGYE